MENQILRVQKMLVESGAGMSTLACSAAKAGEIDIMELLYTEYGAHVFSAKGDGDAPTAYESAVAGNAVESLQWLTQNNVLPPLHDYVRNTGRSTPDGVLLSCDIAFVAAQNGAFEALEYIAGQVPELIWRPVLYQYVRLDFSSRPQYAFSGPQTVVDLSRQDEPLTYAGLLVVCAIAARLKGRDCAPIVARLQRHLEEGESARWRDLELALQYDEPESAALFLRAGLKIDLPEVFERLRQYAAPAAALSLMASELEGAGTTFEEKCREMRVVEPDRRGVTIRTMAELISTVSGYQRVLGDAVKVARQLESDMTERHEEVGAVREVLRQMVRFLRTVDSRFVGPTLLSTAVSKGSAEMVRVVLESVNPNEYPSDDLRRAHPTSDWPRELAVHACTRSGTLALLFEHGADVNLPMKDGEENLLYKMCTPATAPYPDDMFDAFGNCGGDFARKFRGKSAAALVKNVGGKVSERFMAAKTASAVMGAVGEHPVAPPSSTKDRGATPL